MKKAWITCILSVMILAVCVCLLPIKAQAASESDLTFTLNDDGESYCVSDCDEDAAGMMIVPDVYNGKPVTRIGNHAFYNCRGLTNVAIGRCVTAIGDCAFFECYSLRDITMFDSVTTIGNSAFSGCHSFTDVFYEGTENMWSRVEIGIENSTLTCAIIHLTDGIKGVCNLTPSVYWFLSEDGELVIYGDGPVEKFDWDRNAVTSLTILPGVTSIGGGIFMYAENLKQVQIADTVTSIDGFTYCSSLTEITIPDSVTELGTFALAFCPKLTEVTLPADMKAIPEGLFTYCSTLTKLVIPQGVTSIGDYAFDGCDYLSVVFFRGTKADRQSMNIGYVNQNLTSATWHYEVEDAILGGQECYYCSECDGYFLPDGTKIQRYPIGDFTNDNMVNSEDVIYLLWHTMFPESYPVEAPADFTEDGKVNSEDVIYLLWHTMFPEGYPLTDKKKLA